ncbi:MAG: hypothetical protein Fur0022_25870 [Anaerolineales bacterium]
MTMKRFYLLLITVGYLFATLPYLEDFPRMEWAQPMIAAPAWKLASEGVYGMDMFRGFYEADQHNYDHMPLFGLFLAGSFQLFGLGIWQARLVPVLAGLAVIWLTFWLGKKLADDDVGLLAAFFLVALRLSLPNDTDLYNLGYQMNASGIPLLDFARVIRFDVMVPAWVAGACLAYVHAQSAVQSRRWYFLAGILTGLATLTHVYGVFILPVFVLLIFWGNGLRALRKNALSYLCAGFFLALIPYLIYVFQDLPAYLGQSLRHEARFDLLNPAFYWDSLIHEPWRYLSWLGGSFRQAVLWPRVGLWVLVFGLPLSLWMLIWEVQTQKRLEHRLLLVTWPILAGCLALLINMKRYPYTALLLPFLMLPLAWVGVTLWRKFAPARIGVRLLLGGLWVAILIEAGVGVWGSFQMARQGTSHAALSAALREVIPPNARVLGSHSVWFALANYDFYSVNLAFVLSDPQYGYRTTPSMQTVIENIHPDFIVMETRLLKKYLEHPETLPGERQENYLRQLDVYIQTFCPNTVLNFPAEDYGEVKVYQCTP